MEGLEALLWFAQETKDKPEITGQLCDLSLFPSRTECTLGIQVPEKTECFSFGILSVVDRVSHVAQVGLGFSIKPRLPSTP